MEKKQAIPRVILIVGANRGIGYYMVEYLLEHGDFISVLDIEADNLEKLKELPQLQALQVPCRFQEDPYFRVKNQ